MLFNSFEFLFLFLPITCIVFYLLCRSRGPWPVYWLIMASLFFYGWWNPKYLLLLGTSIVFNYFWGSHLRQMTAGQRRSAALIAGIAVNLGLLGYYKYANFFVDAVNTGFDSNFHLNTIILPLAISFFTFQQITFLVDSARRITRECSMAEYMLFVVFFPQLIAGPIVHHKEMLGQFQSFRIEQNITRNLTLGISIFAIGLFKKVAIADTFAQYANPVFKVGLEGGALTSMDAFVGIFSYTFQLYFDFSGYSDMAIGLACMFGLRLPVNFFSPFRAQNISDFWRMWHATLSRFLRDYIYTPLGGFTCSPNRQRFNLFMTMFAGGVWHGAGWTFILYGVCHGLYVVIHQVWRIKVSGPLGLVGKRYYKAAAQLFTFIVIALTLVLFRAETVTAAGHIVSALGNLETTNLSLGYQLAIKNTNSVQVYTALFPNAQVIWLLFASLLAALLVCWYLPNTYQLFEAEDVAILEQRIQRPALLKWQWRDSRRWAVYTGVLLAISFMGLTEVSEFIYFQF